MVHDDRKWAWVLTERAPDLPGVWVSHCLTFDLVSQGPTMKKAIAMIKEAIQLVLEEDLADGRDPFDRATCPAADWERLREAYARRITNTRPRPRSAG